MTKEDKILSKFKDVDSITDIIGDKDPSMLFYLIAGQLYYLLGDDAEKLFSDKSMQRRDVINKIIKTFGPLFLQHKQVFEDKNILLGYKKYESNNVTVGDEAVIWTPNHHFKDDVLGTVLAADRNAYILFGSLPQFFNTFDGIMAWLNGVILVNRKNKNSKVTSIDKGVYLLNRNKDLIVYPEGVWNKSPNKILLNFWPGIYRLSKETGSKVVPIIHYIRDCEMNYKGNLIHTVIDNPINFDNMGEESALRYLRDIMATWYYLMMEKYGQSTREEVIGDYSSSTEAWEAKLKQRILTAARYDKEIELSADYLKKSELEYLKALRDIANITNVTPQNARDIEYAKKMLKENFQRRF